MSDEPEFGLVMPFLPVASKGGPYNDSAYAAGYEMGLLDNYLASTGALRHRLTLRRENLRQADLLAMRHGWRAEFVAGADGEWVDAAFERPGPWPGDTPAPPEHEDR